MSAPFVFTAVFFVKVIVGADTVLVGWVEMTGEGVGLYTNWEN